MNKKMRLHHYPLLFAACCIVLAGCGGRAYIYEAVDTTGLRDRAESQTDEFVRVSAAVPGQQETAAVFGIPLYDKGVQPVWLEVENKGAEQVRYAPVSTDRFYFSPLEVAYKNRSGFSAEARAEMDRRFNKLAMPRYVDPGETRSGFVFTHADSGAKGFNVDLFSSGESFHFTFLLRVPGFVPDYANVDFDSIYSADEVTALQGDDLQNAIRDLPCCTTNAEGEESGDPINVVFVGNGKELLYAMLRSRWIETETAEAVNQEQHYLFGRPQDAIFRYNKVANTGFYEMRAWLAPIVAGEDRVWAAQVRHYFKSGPGGARFDPDVDNARDFTLQNFLLSQSLQAVAWISGEEVVPVESFWANLVRPAYFSDGSRLVIWSSGEPFSVLDADIRNWDTPPGWRR